MDRWLTEFTVTPAIVHAVKTLRLAVPRRVPRYAVGICVDFTDGDVETKDASFEWSGTPADPDLRIRLTDAQKAAACMLVATAAYHKEAMYAALGIKDGDKLPPRFHAHKRRLDLDIRRKLKIKVDGYYYEGLNGGVTVYF